jgi:hypothetical protein
VTPAFRYLPNRLAGTPKADDLRWLLSASAPGGNIGDLRFQRMELSLPLQYRGLQPKGSTGNRSANH